MMKRFDPHNATLAIMKHRKDGICPACGARGQETISNLCLPHFDDHILGCSVCFTVGQVLAMSSDPSLAGQVETGRAPE